MSQPTCFSFHPDRRSVLQRASGGSQIRDHDESVCLSQRASPKSKKMGGSRALKKYRGLGTMFLIDFCTVTPRSEDSGWVNKIDDYDSQTPAQPRVLITIPGRRSPFRALQRRSKGAGPTSRKYFFNRSKVLTPESFSLPDLRMVIADVGF